MKQLARRCIKRAKSWLNEPPGDPVVEEAKRFPDSAYGELNGHLFALIRQFRHALRPNYTWGLLHSAHLARALGVSTISVIEFGVAGGNGLICMENAAAAVRRLLGIKIDVYGFDTGKGLPKPVDFRDLPNIFQPHSYPMDFPRLKNRLKSAKLILGPIGETLPAFFAEHRAPVGFVSIDVDYYSSTVEVLKLLKQDPRWLLPRVHCYFDDILGMTYADFNGERLAIKEFNATGGPRQISQIYGLSYFVPEAFANQPWTQCMYLAHITDHDLYCLDDGLIYHPADEASHPMAPNIDMPPENS